MLFGKEYCCTGVSWEKTKSYGGSGKTRSFLALAATGATDAFIIMSACRYPRIFISSQK